MIHMEWRISSKRLLLAGSLRIVLGELEVTEFVIGPAALRVVDFDALAGQAVRFCRLGTAGFAFGGLGSTTVLGIGPLASRRCWEIGSVDVMMSLSVVKISGEGVHSGRWLLRG